MTVIVVFCFYLRMIVAFAAQMHHSVRNTQWLAVYGVPFMSIWVPLHFSPLSHGWHAWRSIKKRTFHGKPLPLSTRWIPCSWRHGCKMEDPQIGRFVAFVLCSPVDDAGLLRHLFGRLYDCCPYRVQGRRMSRCLAAAWCVPSPVLLLRNTPSSYLLDYYVSTA